MQIIVWRFQNYRDCKYTCNPHKFEIPALRFPRKDPVIPCKHLQCTVLHCLSESSIIIIFWLSWENNVSISLIITCEGLFTRTTGHMVKNWHCKGHFFSEHVIFVYEIEIQLKVRFSVNITKNVMKSSKYLFHRRFPTRLLFKTLEIWYTSTNFQSNWKNVLNALHTV